MLITNNLYMFQRLALKALRQWAEKEGRKPLVLRGARQVGKTTLVKIFAEEFDVFINLNVFRDMSARIAAVFAGRSLWIRIH